MRRNILHAGDGTLSYAIREIVRTGHEIRDMGVPMIWENIGDPVAKGESVLAWIREAVAQLAASSASWAYCDSAGIPETRAYVASANATEPAPVGRLAPAR